jgi:signal transduction histidine kinase
MAPPPARRSSLVARLVGLAAAWSLAVLVVAGLALSIFFNHTATARVDDELTEILDGLVAGTSWEGGAITLPSVSDPGASRAYPGGSRALRAYSGEYWEIAAPEPGGGLKALARSRSLWDRALPAPPGGGEALVKTPGEFLAYEGEGPVDQPLRIGAEAIRLPDAPAPFIFMAALDRSPVNRDIRTFIATLAVALGTLGLGLIVAVIVQVRVGLRPLFALQREVAEVRLGRLERVEGHYPTELEPLASELNALVAHNQQVVERQRTHVGNLAHALKTPLSVMLTEAGQRPGPLAEVVTRQAATMSQQVDHHLRRARAAARNQALGERTEVAPVIEDLGRTLERIFQDKMREVDVECPEALWFLGERQDLLEVIGNVMENACKWCRGKVRVTASPAPGRARQLLITVEDDGPGLAEDQRETVLRRGARLDESAPGSGLGLSIVDELARAYGGGVTLGRSALGGLRVEILLPRAEA